MFVKDGLAERVAAEGARSPADVLMTVDFGNLVDLVDKGVTQPVSSEVLEAAIPANLRDAEGALVRAVHARPRRLCVEGTGAQVHHLRGARRPEVEGQGLHPLGPAPLQHRADRRLHRHHGRREGRGLAARRQGQPRAQGRRRRPRGRARHSRRHLRHRHRQLLLCRPDALGRRRPDQQQVGRGDRCAPADLRRPAARTSTFPARRSPRMRRTAQAAVKLLEFLVSDDAQKIYAKAISSIRCQGRQGRPDHRRAWRADDRPDARSSTSSAIARRRANWSTRSASTINEHRWRQRL